MALTDHEKWSAVLGCDETYDGEFYYGVRTTGVFCRPSCKSRAPLRENVEFFDAIEAAYSYGLRPCKRCRPDLRSYQPMMELIEKAKSIYDTHLDDGNQLALQIQQLGVSRNHLIRLFRQHLNVTPVEYMNKLRVERATQLLSSTDASILSISLLCGFGSLSAFYECFKKQLGLAPNEYRKGYGLHHTCCSCLSTAAARLSRSGRLESGK